MRSSEARGYRRRGEVYRRDKFSSRDFSYDKLSGISGLSYSYFKKLFITRFGIPPREYVIGKRIDYARELLSTGLMSISDVAELAGFDNVYYFSTVFVSRSESALRRVSS